MRALITGVSGQDGRLLSEILAQHGFEVTGTTRSNDLGFISKVQLLLPEVVDLITLDICSFADWKKLLSSKKFDIIFHFAAQSSVGKSFLEPLFSIVSPTESSFYLLESVRLYQPETKVIFAGSTEVFGSHGSLSINECSFKKPSSPYAAGKLSQEAVIAFYRNSHGMWISNAYLSNHESLYRSNQFVTMKIVRGAFDILNKKSSALKLGNLSVIRDWGWAPEYMNAIFLLSQKDAPMDVIIATGNSISLLEFATVVFESFGISFQQYVRYDSSLLRADDPSEVYYDVSLSRDVLKWEAKTTGISVPQKLAQAFRIKHLKNG